MTLFQNESIGVLSNQTCMRMPFHILSSHTVFHQCGITDVFSKYLAVRMSFYTLSRQMAFLLYVFFGVFSDVTLKVLYNHKHCMIILDFFLHNIHSSAPVENDLSNKITNKKLSLLSQHFYNWCTIKWHNRKCNNQINHETFHKARFPKLHDKFFLKRGVTSYTTISFAQFFSPAPFMWDLIFQQKFQFWVPHGPC